LFGKILYSGKFLALILVVLYTSLAYVTANFDFVSIVAGTAVACIVLVYLAYYAHVHRSIGEVKALLFFTSLAIVLGALTGIVLYGWGNVGSLTYALALTILILAVNLALSKLYRLR